ncbi:protein of unknown function [Streptantibioticus cattleyicolor NRRL 8057 = DSM 46488]|nr:protein of unknown function [Streptantibioticus cattleyicolor NRRL 8057 = DSM 46488]
MSNNLLYESKAPRKRGARPRRTPSAPLGARPGRRRTVAAGYDPARSEHAFGGGASGSGMTAGTAVVTGASGAP